MKAIDIMKLFSVKSKMLPRYSTNQFKLLDNETRLRRREEKEVQGKGGSCCSVCYIANVPSLI